MVFITRLRFEDDNEGDRLFFGFDNEDNEDDAMLISRGVDMADVVATFSY